MGKRGTFGSRFGIIAAVGGSVVGLGNIWRFPYVAGENGGAAFIFVYILISFLVAIPIMLSEFSIGRNARRNSFRAFRKLAPGTRWYIVGLVGISTAFVIMTFYSMIGGWSLEFLKEAILNNFADKSTTEITSDFNQFVNNGWRPAMWVLIFVAASAVIVFLGVEKGIERYNKILMPMLAIMLVGLVINSFTLEGAKEGISFLLNPDFSKITPSVLLEALGQAFFSLSLGMGAMITYGSYIKKNENMFKIAPAVALSDVTIAILSGLAIFPAVFSFGISPTSGPELVFITLPNVFQQMAGGYIIAIVFFALVFMAAITSSVSLIEVVTAYLSEEMLLGRKKATIIASSSILVMGLLCVASQMEDSPIIIFGSRVFDIADTLSSVYMLPIGGLFIVIFAGWFMNQKALKNELTNNGTVSLGLYKVVIKLIKYVAPVVIAMLFLNKLGLI